jgi:hypothetical protein
MALRHSHFQTLALVAMMLLIGSTFAKGDEASDDDLVKLARKQTEFGYDKLTNQERSAFDKFFLNIHQGQVAYFQPNDSSENDVSNGKSWGPERTIKADWIMWLCKNQVAVKMVPPSGIIINHAKLQDRIDIAWVKLEFPLSVLWCYLTDGVDLSGAEVRGLKFLGSYADYPKELFGALVGDNLTVQGDVDLEKCKMLDRVSFENAKISGHFFATQSEFTGQAFACDLSFANISKGVKFDSTTAIGGINIRNAEIRGDLVCYSGKFIPNRYNNHELAVDGYSMKVGGDVGFGRGMTVIGTISIRHANIAGILSFIGTETQLLRDVRDVIDAVGAKIGGDAFIDMSVSSKGLLNFYAASIDGALSLVASRERTPGDLILDLRDAKVRILSNGQINWPTENNLRLQEFVFSELGRTASLDARTQIRWLRLQWPFVIQPYEQMAAVFRNMGYEEEGVKVSVSGKRAEGEEVIRSDRRTIRDAAKDRNIFLLIETGARFVFYDLLWFRGFGWLIGYGYRPWNALFVSIGFVIVGTLVFRLAERERILKKSLKDRPPQRRDRWRKVDRNFSAFIYSLETFIPLVKLGVADTWKVDGNAGRRLKIGNVSIRESGTLVLWDAHNGRLGFYLSMGRCVHRDIETLNKLQLFNRRYLLACKQAAYRRRATHLCLVN